MGPFDPINENSGLFLGDTLEVFIISYFDPQKKRKILYATEANSFFS